MARGKAVAIDLTATERGELEALRRRHGTAQALARRARIVLLAADGLTNNAIAQGLGIAKHTVGKWRNRFAAARLGLRRTLKDESLAPWPKLTGGKGLHLMAPLDRSIDRDQGRAYAKQIARRLAATAPDRYTTSSAPDRRAGRIFIDDQGCSPFRLRCHEATAACEPLMSVSASGARSEHSPSRSVADCGDPTPRPGI